MVLRQKEVCRTFFVETDLLPKISNPCINLSENAFADFVESVSYPSLCWGSASLINLHGPIEKFPRDLLKDNRKTALLFKKLATLRTDAPLFDDVEELHWRGPSKAFPSMTEKIGDARLATRVAKLQKGLSKGLT